LKTLEQDVTIDSVTYNAGAALESKIDRASSGELPLGDPCEERSRVRLNVGLGATFFDATGRFGQPPTDPHIADSVTFEKSLWVHRCHRRVRRWQVVDRWYIEAELGGSRTRRQHQGQHVQAARRCATSC
jgi:hypothetical protein